MTRAAKAPLNRDEPLSVIVVGASGDLAMRKIFPALFALYCQGLLPVTFSIVGFSRTDMSDEVFRERVTENLTCRYTPGESCADRMAEFLARCFYCSGAYKKAEDFQSLRQRLLEVETAADVNRVFYMAIPPFLFLDVAHSLAGAGLVRGEHGPGWSRVVIEKPFGSDRATSDELTNSMAQVFTEEQTFRIDHYLGKEVIQNLLVLRFANLVFEPLWSRSYIANVCISWTENLSLTGRAGYFDSYGIIRDVMQNHLLQILALIAMEQPISLHSRDVRDEKVKVLRCVPGLERKDLVVGQYSGAMIGAASQPGYLDEPGVPSDSVTPTFAACVLHVQNRRWDGVPFLIKAGKGLNTRHTEIRIRLRPVPANIFAKAMPDLVPNEIVIRVQPDERISLSMATKVPGLTMMLAERDLNLQYESAFPVEIPDAYESLILDVIRGDKSLFIRADELEAAWDVFTPVLHELETNRVRPEPYVFGSAGPGSADVLASRYGASW